MGAVPVPAEFVVDVGEADIADLRERLSRARLPDDRDNEDWAYGTNTAYLAELVEYWRDEYDWRTHERAINALPHYRVELDGTPIHFVHVRGKGPDPQPLILTHGWPWTFWDWRKVIGPLTDPAAHGGDPADAFDVVVPSLPGFGFSVPITKHVCWIDTADLWARLMRDVLGYDQFFAAAGDWGMWITAQLAHKYAESVRGIQINGAPRLSGFSGDRPWDLFGDPGPTLTPEERRQTLDWQRHRASHVSVHVLGSQTLANALHDSPAGLCSWLLERRRWWSDCDGDVESVFTKDDLLTGMSIYWFTDSLVSSVRYYREATLHPWVPVHDAIPHVQVPTAVSVFRDVPRPPELEVLAKTYNVSQLRVHDHGGHFAPAEAPDVVIGDIRDAFRPHR